MGGTTSSAPKPLTSKDSKQARCWFPMESISNSSSMEAIISLTTGRNKAGVGSPPSDPQSHSSGEEKVANTNYERYSIRSICPGIGQSKSTTCRHELSANGGQAKQANIPDCLLKINIMPCEDCYRRISQLGSTNKLGTSTCSIGCLPTQSTCSALLTSTTLWATFGSTPSLRSTPWTTSKFTQSMKTLQPLPLTRGTI